jgi:hypothetical protein
MDAGFCLGPPQSVQADGINRLAKRHRRLGSLFSRKSDRPCINVSTPGMSWVEFLIAIWVVPTRDERVLDVLEQAREGGEPVCPDTLLSLGSALREEHAGRLDHARIFERGKGALAVEDL